MLSTKWSYQNGWLLSTNLSLSLLRAISNAVSDGTSPPLVPILIQNTTPGNNSGLQNHTATYYHQRCSDMYVRHKLSNLSDMSAINVVLLIWNYSKFALWHTCNRLATKDSRVKEIPWIIATQPSIHILLFCKWWAKKCHPTRSITTEFKTQWIQLYKACNQRHMQIICDYYIGFSIYIYIYILYIYIFDVFFNNGTHWYTMIIRYQQCLDRPKHRARHQQVTLAGFAPMGVYNASWALEYQI